MNPHVDFHALAPELVLTATILVVLIADLVWPERSRFTSSRIASVGVLAALINMPINDRQIVRPAASPA